MVIKQMNKSPNFLQLLNSFFLPYEYYYIRNYSQKTILFKAAILIITNIIISRMFKKLVIGLIGVSVVSPLHSCQSFQAPQDNKRHAISILYPHNSNVRGVVSFSQDSILSPTKVCCSVKGLNPNAKHGIHVHEFGDLTDGCTTAGPHYNPHGKNHGGPFQGQRHVGDLGNLISDPFGNSFMCFVDKQISLFGQYSIIGRSVVVHGGQDDLGKGGNQQSLKTGNSGTRVACGVIGLSKQFKGLNPNQPIQEVKKEQAVKKE